MIYHHNYSSYMVLTLDRVEERLNVENADIFLFLGILEISKQHDLCKTKLTMSLLVKRRPQNPHSML